MFMSMLVNFFEGFIISRVVLCVVVKLGCGLG